jgi:hypothetical protein
MHHILKCQSMRLQSARHMYIAVRCLITCLRYVPMGGTARCRWTALRGAVAHQIVEPMQGASNRGGNIRGADVWHCEVPAYGVVRCRRMAFVGARALPYGEVHPVQPMSQTVLTWHHERPPSSTTSITVSAYGSDDSCARLQDYCTFPTDFEEWGSKHQLSQEPLNLHFL